MSARTILTMSNGKGIDLLDPRPGDIDFAAIAEHLAKEKRYNGATPDVEYSVAEHCARCADAAMAQTGNRTLAAYALLHDGHEATLKDDTTPKKQALAEIAEQQFGILAGDIMAAFALLTDRHDRAIHEAAGLAWPPTNEIKSGVKRFDLILFVTEWRDVMQDAPHPNWAPYSGFQALPDTIIPMSWMTAREAWLRRARVLLPALKEAA